jgi:hypothetical protein
VRRATFLVVTLSMLLCGVGQSRAGIIIPVGSYDIFDGRPSGFGGWANSYTGTISPNVDGTVNYTGGAGTLNDGVLPTDASNSQLYYTSDDSVTVLHLAGGPFDVASIDLFGFNNGNGIPGNITEVAVTIDGVTEQLPTVGFGPVNSSEGYLVNAELVLTGTALASLPTSTIDIQVTGTQGSDLAFYTIGEVQVGGTAAATVPEPSTLTIFSGLGAIGLIARWRRRKLAEAQNGP